MTTHQTTARECAENRDTNHRERVPMQLFRHVPNRRGLAGVRAEDVAARAQRHLDTLRDQFLDRFPSQTAGLDLARVRRFLDGFGLDLRAPLVVLDRDRAVEVADVVYAMTGQQLSATAEGMYVPLLEVVVVLRDKDLEARNGTEFTESIIVHEATHASGRRPIVRAITSDTTEAIAQGNAKWNLELARSRQVVHAPDGRRHGYFLEEALAEFARGQYITHALGRPRGFSPSTTETLPVTGTDGTETLVPARYGYDTDSGNTAMVISALAATALELLVERDHRLLPALLHARTTVTGQREVAARLNTIAPGLYLALRDRFDHPDTFHHGLNHVTTVLATTQHRTPGHDRQYTELTDTLTAMMSAHHHTGHSAGHRIPHTATTEPDPHIPASDTAPHTLSLD